MDGGAPFRDRMTRDRQSLNGGWSFWPDVSDVTASASYVAPKELTTTLGPPRSIVVPGCQAQFADLRTWAPFRGMPKRSRG
jgi:hypothetical protein